MRIENTVQEGPMQDKIQFTPPTVHIFGGKPPPTSWFTDNIIQYLQTNSKPLFYRTLFNVLKIYRGHMSQIKKTSSLKLAPVPSQKLEPNSRWQIRLPTMRPNL